MDAGSDHGSAAKGSAIDLEVAGSGPVGCCFSVPSSFLTMCSSLACLQLIDMQSMKWNSKSLYMHSYHTQMTLFRTHSNCDIVRL